ncbi:hypothetical protein BDW75DRAFT_207311 [Aspergillus navahoensis]
MSPFRLGCFLHGMISCGGFFITAHSITRPASPTAPSLPVRPCFLLPSQSRLFPRCPAPSSQKLGFYISSTQAPVSHGPGVQTAPEDPKRGFPAGIASQRISLLCISLFPSNQSSSIDLRERKALRRKGDW